MVFGNPIPWWALLLVVTAAALAAWVPYARLIVPVSRRQRGVLTALRFTTLLLLAAYLLRPMLVEPAPVAHVSALVPVLVDVSRSMRIADVGDTRRIEYARTLLDEQIMPVLGREFQVELLSFGEVLAPADAGQLQANGRWSDLTGALADVVERYRGRNVAGIVVISDGGDTSGREPETTGGVNVPPVYPIGVGSRHIVRDREVLSLTAGQAALAESVIDLGVTIVSHGFGESPVDVRVLENGRPIEVRRVPIPADGSPVRETFRVSPSGEAATLYTVEIPRDSTELVPGNNTRGVLVRAPGPRRRVLFVEGAPGFEHSFLKRALGEDPGLELDAVVRKGQNDRGEETFYVQAGAARTAALAQRFSVAREALFAYDALILGNVEGHTLTGEQLGMAADFVSVRGGGLLVLGGLSFAGRGLVGTKLEEVLPVELTGRGGLARAARPNRREPNKVELTIDGVAHPVMRLGSSEPESEKRWADLPVLASITRLGAPRPGASVLAVSAGPGGWEPVVAVQQYGRGRAMVFAGEASWRWRMLLPAENRAYETFWRQVVRWLAIEAPRPVSLTASSGGTVGEPMTIEIGVQSQRFEPVRDASIDIRVTEPGGDVRDVTALVADSVTGAYEARIQPDQPGVYEIRVEARRADMLIGESRDWVLVGGAEAELTDPRLNDALLRRLATASDGRYVEESEIAQLASWLRVEATESVPLVRRDLWHNSWTFLAVVLLLSVEWTLRRHWGLR